MLQFCDTIFLFFLGFVKIELTKQTGELSYEICNMECKRLQSSTEERL